MKEDFLLNGQFFVQTITELSEFDKLKTKWDSLATKQGSYMPFLCFDWFKIWFDHFLKDRRLLIFLLYNGSKLVTIAPFVISEENFKGINARKIELAGNVYSPIRYFLLDNSELAEQCISSILKFFIKNYKEWDILDFYGIPEENSSFDVLMNQISETNLKNTGYFCYRNMYIDGIDYSGEEYLNRRPGNISKNVPYRIRRLQRIGNLEFRLITNEDNIDHYIDIYYELYARSWQKREHIGPTFHRSLVKMAAINAWLRLGFLYFNNVPIACQFWISADHYAYILKLFYDDHYQQYAPGKILTAHIARHVIDVDKVQTIDYIHGDEPYKKDWTPKRRERRGITVYNNNRKGQYFALLSNRILPVLNKYTFLRKAKEVVARQIR